MDRDVRATSQKGSPETGCRKPTHVQALWSNTSRAMGVRQEWEQRHGDRASSRPLAHLGPEETEGRLPRPTLKEGNLDAC